MRLGFVRCSTMVVFFAVSISPSAAQHPAAAVTAIHDSLFRSARGKAYFRSDPNYPAE